jgi:peroxiredoxin
MNVLLSGEVTELVGEPLKVGDTLPHFKLEDENGDKVKTADLVGKLTLISVVPDLNTGTCSLQTRHFNQAVDQFQDVQFLTISTNSVSDQRDWCAAKGYTICVCCQMNKSHLVTPQSSTSLLKVLIHVQFILWMLKVLCVMHKLYQKCQRNQIMMTH